MEAVGNLLWRQASPQQTDKTSCYYPVCLPTQIIHQEPSRELRRSPPPVALAGVAALREVKWHRRKRIDVSRRSQPAHRSGSVVKFAARLGLSPPGCAKCSVQMRSRDPPGEGHTSPWPRFTWPLIRLEVSRRNPEAAGT